MQIESWLIVGSGLFFSGMLQSIAGFDFSLLLIPLLLLSGQDIVTCVTIGICGSMMQRLLAVRYLGGHIDWKQLLLILPIGGSGLIVGLYLLYRFSGLDPRLIRQIIGSIIMTLVILRWVLRVEPVENVKRIWGYLAGFFSGLLTGLANIGGPPFILWVLSHKWHQKKMRIMSLAYSVMFVPFQIIVMTLMFGNSVILIFVQTLLFFPLIYFATVIGIRAGNKFSGNAVRIVMYSMLVAISCFAIIKPFFEKA